MKAFILSLTLFSSSVICSQSVEGLDFMTYPAREIEFKKKAKINWKTNPYKNKVKEIRRVNGNIISTTDIKYTFY